MRKEVDRNFAGVGQIAQVIRASLRPLPTETGDGTYIDRGSDDSNVLKDLTSVGLVNGIKDAGTLLELLRESITGDPMDDNKYIIENVVKVGCSLSKTWPDP